jgi:hypothetical protein
MVNPDIRKLQILNDLIAQTLDVINQRSLAGGLSHSPYVPEFGISPINPVFAQYGLGSYGIPQAFAQPQIGQLGQGVSFGNPWNQGLTHSPFAPWASQSGQGFGGFGQGAPGQSFGQGFGGIGQGAVGQPFGQGLSHSPFTPWGAQLGQGVGGFGQGAFGQQLGQGLAGFGQQLGQLPYASPWSQGLMHSPFVGIPQGYPAQGYGVDPRLASFASPYSQGFAGRFSGIGGIPGVVGGVPGIGVAAGVPYYGFGG